MPRQVIMTPNAPSSPLYSQGVKVGMTEEYARWLTPQSEHSHTDDRLSAAVHLQRCTTSRRRR